MQQNTGRSAIFRSPSSNALGEGAGGWGLNSRHFAPVPDKSCRGVSLKRPQSMKVPLVVLCGLCGLCGYLLLHDLLTFTAARRQRERLPRSRKISDALGYRRRRFDKQENTAVGASKSCNSSIMASCRVVSLKRPQSIKVPIVVLCGLCGLCGYLLLHDLLTFTAARRQRERLPRSHKITNALGNRRRRFDKQENTAVGASKSCNSSIMASCRVVSLKRPQSIKVPIVVLCGLCGLCGYLLLHDLLTFTAARQREWLPRSRKISDALGYRKWRFDKQENTENSDLLYGVVMQSQFATHNIHVS